jgi:thymidine kinase
VLSLGISVIVAALDGTFNQRAFGRVLDLVPLADSVVKLTAVCHTCGADAPFTRRIGADTRTEVIGGSEAYAACCRACLTRYK